MVEELKKRQIQLVQAQKLSSIGTLSSGIAHQLNNPLNNISTSAQILAEETAGQSEFSDKMLGNITQETMRARDIVKGLLEFSGTRISRRGRTRSGRCWRAPCGWSPASSARRFR